MPIDEASIAFSAPRRRTASRAILDLDLGDDGIMIHEHADGKFTIDVGSERCVLDAGQFREFVHCVTMIGNGKGWTASAAEYHPVGEDQPNEDQPKQDETT